jgi:hypothetical protein
MQIAYASRIDALEANIGGVRDKVAALEVEVVGVGRNVEASLADHRMR